MLLASRVRDDARWLFMLTATQIVDLMSHAIRATADTRHDLWATLNRAGRALVSSREWSWRRVGPTQVSGLIGVSSLALPANFSRLLTIHRDDQDGGFALVGLEELVRARAIGTGDATVLLHFPTWTQQAAATDVLVMKAEMWPASGANGSPSFTMVYLKDWTELSSAAPTALPAIPAAFENALVLLARAYAVQIELGQVSSDLSAYAAEIARLQFEDEGRQRQSGQICGGADRFYTSDSLAEPKPSVTFA